MRRTITKGQIIIIKTLIGKLGVKDANSLTSGFSNKRTQHVSELWLEEANDYIKHLKGLDPDEQAAERMRKKMIGLAYEYEGIGRSATAERKREAVARLKAWVAKYGVGVDGKHQRLDDYDARTLPALVSQFEKVYKEYLEKIHNLWQKV